MRLYYDIETGNALYTIQGMEPEGDFIEVPNTFDADLALVRVEDGELLILAPDPLEALLQRRSEASMSRSEFLLACIADGIIQPSDAGPAARGEIPPSLLPVFETLPEAFQVEAVVRWGAATMIERTNPILGLLAEAMNLTDERLDQLFGIEPLTLPGEPEKEETPDPIHDPDNSPDDEGEDEPEEEQLELFD